MQNNFYNLVLKPGENSINSAMDIMVYTRWTLSLEFENLIRDQLGLLINRSSLLQTI